MPSADALGAVITQPQASGSFCGTLRGAKLRSGSCLILAFKMSGLAFTDRSWRGPILEFLMFVRLGAAICGVTIMFACSSAVMAESGIASIYAYDGEKTANGEHANPRGLTAAHRTLPFGTHVRVTNQRNGRSVTVRINDRGPFVRGRVIDLTPAGARALGFSAGEGLTRVKLEIART